MDLAAFFDETAAAIAPRKGKAISTFPNPEKTSGNGQASEDNSISHVSHVSQAQTEAAKLPKKQNSQAGAGARARGGNVRPWETWETWEIPAESKTCISHSPSKKWKKERESGKSMALPADPAFSAAFDERAAFLEYECGLSRAAAEIQARVDLEREASTTVGLPTLDGLLLWRAGFATLKADSAPCPGYRGAEWSMTLARARAFLDTFGERAVALGWTAPRLFGVHPVAGIVRVDACGALVLPIGGAVRALTATEVAFGHLTHRTKIGQPEGVPIWEFAAGAERDRLRLSSIARQCLSTGAEEARAMAGSVSRTPQRHAKSPMQIHGGVL